MLNSFNSFMTEARLLRKSMDWFLYDNGLRHERANITCSERMIIP